jgi:hypothetical protein
MNVYEVCRSGVYKCQIAADNLQQAKLWVDDFMPGCSVRFVHRLS